MSSVTISEGSFNCPINNQPILSNDCGDIITILPMEVECFTTGSTNSTSVDGTVMLSITGGTEPYSISWENGFDGLMQTVRAGIYNFTVSDFYNDYVITGSCEVISLFTPTPTMTPTMTPTPTQSSLLPNFLCLTNNISFFTFEYDGVDSSGNPTWASGSLLVYFNVRNNRWEVLNWTPGTMVMVNSQNLNVPIGNTWYSMNKQWTMTSGECVEDELALTAIASPESCQNLNDGSVILNATGGDGDYCYRIFGLAPYPLFQSSNVFTSIPPGTYFAEVTDGCPDCDECSGGNIVSDTFVVLDGPGEQYVLTLSSTLTNSTSNFRTVQYSISVNPLLPAGVSIDFTMFMNYTYNYNREVGSSYMPRFGLTDTSFSATTTLENTVPSPRCEDDEIRYFTGVTDTIDVTMTSANPQILRTFTHSINQFTYDWATCSCPSIAQSTVSVNITNIIIVSPQNCSTVTKQGSISSSFTLQNCIS